MYQYLLGKVSTKEIGRLNDLPYVYVSISIR